MLNAFGNVEITSFFQFPLDTLDSGKHEISIDPARKKETFFPIIYDFL